jgi:phosphopantothenoylcysteine decarboxylase/phosphopantothenate--cysteine ligase
MAKVVVVVTGGIAAYKAAALVSLLAKHEWDIRVVLTASAQHFVAPATFAALSAHPVVTDVFDPHIPMGAHIELARWADVLVVAPATANWLAKAAVGLADDLAGLLYVAFPGPVLVAPAMNAEMWAHPTVQRNVQQLLADGMHLVGPDSGWQSCRTSGDGRMSEPPEILARLTALLEP